MERDTKVQKKEDPDVQKKEDDEAKRRKGSEFFASLKLAPSEHLDTKGKIECPRCKKQMKYYCYNCVMVTDKEHTPVVKLPINLDIIHHPSEKLSKRYICWFLVCSLFIIFCSCFSTAIHAVILSKEAVMHESPNVPDYDPKETVLLFPSATAVDISVYPDLKNIKRVVVVDSQWQKTNGIISHPNLSKLPCVVISKQNTFFWRYQDVGEECLATIEAIFYFFRQLHQARHPDTPYEGQYDNLLFFYSHIYKTIQNAYQKEGKKMNRIPNFVEDVSANEEKGNTNNNNNNNNNNDNNNADN